MIEGIDLNDEWELPTPVRYVTPDDLSPENGWSEGTTIKDVEGTIINADGDFVFVRTFGSPPGPVYLANEHDVHRAMACINACAGIPTSVLEQYGVIPNT